NSKFTTDNYDLCNNMFPGGTAEFGDSRVVGIQPSGDGGSNGGVKGKPGQVTVGGGSGATVSAGADDGGFGILVTALSSETERDGTELENGFESDLSGFVLGTDYQFSDSFIMGVLVGSTEDDLSVVGGGGGLETESSSQTVYATWTPIDNLSVDFYYGNVDSDIESVRNLNITSPSANLKGVITGSYDAEQTIQGASISYDWSSGAWSLGGFIGLDSVKTETDGYTEEGQRTNSPGPSEPPTTPQEGDPTGFELIYPDQEIESATRSIGLRASYSAQYGWGMLLPNIKIISVKENKNDARTIPVIFASTAASSIPGEIEPFFTGTDDPDRDYMTSGLGLVVALNNGVQIFLDYEQRSGHDFLETSSITLGALIGF
ncbi:MAG TPA: autotransporter outer membrane beta-barrel domain-containing protein, partial [Gammaproteobacteria bacterium]